MPDPSSSPSLPSCHFFGRWRQKLDEKGRLTLPSVYRRRLPEEGDGHLVLIPGPEGYLQIVPIHEWEERMDRLTAEARKAGESGSRLRQLLRSLFSGIESVQLDEKGRFAVPRPLLDGHEIQREALLVGVDRVLELWNPERFFARIEDHPTDLTQYEDILF